MKRHQDMLRDVYAAYNRRDSAALLALVSEDVDWPDGPARLHGKHQLQAYWEQQWTRIHTHDQPVAITALSRDRSAVRISQVVRALDGTVLSEGMFVHTFAFDRDLIVRLDIETITDPTSSPAVS